jgi:uncharacterized protein (TIGR03437 family)
MRSVWHSKGVACAVIAAAVFPVYGQFAQVGNELVGAGSSGDFIRQGTSVALSGDGNTVLIGGPGDNSTVGAVWVFVNSGGGVWSPQGSKLAPTDYTGTLPQFGYSVALSSDGNTALIGGYTNNYSFGSAWVYTRSGTVWTEQAMLTGTGAQGSYPFQGFAVALSSDGNTALIGGPYDNSAAGAAWIFTRSGTIWTQQGDKLVGSGASGSSEQGSAVALSSDGNTALIGGPYDNSSNGAAWIFTRSNGAWNQQGQKLVGTGGNELTEQGWSVALSGDGATALIGGPFDGPNGFAVFARPSGFRPRGFGFSTGAVWIFTLSGGSWSQQGSKLVGAGFSGSPAQGYSAALSSDGNMALSGGPYDDGSGAAWVFTRSGGVWTQNGAQVVGTGNTGDALQGSSVALSAANTAIIGGSTDNDYVGGAWIFALPSLSVTAPASTAPGTSFNITVTAYTPTGAVDTGYSDSVQFTSTDGAALLPPNSTLTSGTGQFSVTLNTTGYQTITATDTTFSTVTATSATVAVSTAAPAPPILYKAFGYGGTLLIRKARRLPLGKFSATVPLNGSTSLTFNIQNANASSALTGVGFTDLFPAGLVVASPNGLTGTCGGGTILAAAGGSSVSLSGATVAATSTCTFSVMVTGTIVGDVYNVTSPVTSNEGAGNAASASVTVLPPNPPIIAKAFGSAVPVVAKASARPLNFASTPTIPLNGSLPLTFNIVNPNASSALTAVGFTDLFPAGLFVASPSGLTGTCGGGAITAVAGSGSTSLSGATLAAGAACTFSVNVTGTTAGTKSNVTSGVASNEAGAGGTASATLTVVAPPSLTISAPNIPVNGFTTFSYTVTNPSVNTVALTGVAFTANFPPDLLVASPNGLGSTCGGTVAAVAGSGSVSLSGGTIPPGASCTLAVNVTATVAQLYTVGGTTVASTNGGTGNTTASVPLNVLVPITLNTAPAGLSILVDGFGYINGQPLLLPFNTTLIISVVTPEPGTPGTRYVFKNWSDGGAVGHAIYIPATPTTYTATFTTQYQLTVALTPVGGGTVTPASGGFYNTGATVALTAVPNAGYAFTGWTGANPSSSASTTVVMSGPESITASFQASGPAPPQTNGVLNGGSFQPGQATPNTILSLFGTNLSCTPAPQVLVNGVQAQVLFSSGTQINFVIPSGLGGSGNASLQVVCNGVNSPAVTLALSAANPAIFALTETGAGQGAILNQDYTVNGAQSPANLGSYVMVYGTGFGNLSPAGSDGLQHLALPVTAAIGGVAAQVTYAGEAPGFTLGLQQINILIPENAPVGLTVPIQLFVDNLSTQIGVTIAIQ